MDGEKKLYLKVGAFRLLDIRVIYNDKLIYEGSVEEASENIKELRYSKVGKGTPLTLYVYE